MAGLEMTIKTSEYRPCIVNGKKAFFHKWSEFAKVVSEGILNPYCQIKYTLGIVEYEDGTVEEVRPDKIKFLDHNLFYEICFDDKEVLNNE